MGLFSVDFFVESVMGLDVLVFVGFDFTGVEVVLFVVFSVDFDTLLNKFLVLDVFFVVVCNFSIFVVDGISVVNRVVRESLNSEGVKCLLSMSLPTRSWIRSEKADETAIGSRLIISMISLMVLCLSALSLYSNKLANSLADRFGLAVIILKIFF